MRVEYLSAMPLTSISAAMPASKTPGICLRDPRHAPEQRDDTRLALGVVRAGRRQAASKVDDAQRGRRVRVGKQQGNLAAGGAGDRTIDRHVAERLELHL